VNVRPKKHLGQHFLNDPNIARKITGSILGQPTVLLEVGPGTGALTRHLVEKFPYLIALEIDPESIAYLRTNQIISPDNIIPADFLEYDLNKVLRPGACIVGNFPYNISSQIFFKILDNKHLVDQVVGMVQYEVAERIAAPPGSKQYGILSVLLNAFYRIELLFKVPPTVFFPPPKVNSAVIRLSRNNRQQLPCNEENFRLIVKTSFGQRRKMLRNSLRNLFPQETLSQPLFERRPEHITIEEFIELTRWYETANNNP